MTRMATFDKRKRTSNKPSRSRAKRPKTFKSENAAKKYAETNNLKSYKLVNISVSTRKEKIKIVTE